MAKEQRNVSVAYQFPTTPGLTGTLQLDSSEAYRTLAHPLRASLLALLRVPRSAKELAAELEVPVARLYHHIKLLQKNGLVVVVDERRAGSNAERVYRIAAARIEISGTADWDESLRETNPRLAETHRRFSDAIELATEARLKAERTQGDPLLDPWLVEAIGELDEQHATRVVDLLRQAIREIKAEMDRAYAAERPALLNERSTDGEPAARGRRYGLHIAFTPFPDGKEQRWTEITHKSFDPT